MATNIFKLQAIQTQQGGYMIGLPGVYSDIQEGFECTIDWGDGSVDVYPDGEVFHDVQTGGIHTVTVTYNDKGVYHIAPALDPVDPVDMIFRPYVVEMVLDTAVDTGGNAFQACTSLTKLTLGATVPPTLGEDAFASANNLTAIYVPYSAVNAYKTAAIWSTFADIIRGYFPMKTVTPGEHYTTVTVDGGEAVKFSFPSASLSVEASGGDITVALTDTAVAGDDGTLTIPDGESRMFIHHRMNVDTYYLTGSGTATLYASNMSDVNPFKGKSKGGDGGGTLGIEDVVLWENTGTTNPETITLSEAWSNFDELAIVTDYTYQGVHFYNTNIKLTSTFTMGESVMFWYYDNSVTASYFVTSSTTFTYNDGGGQHFLHKIIGRRYTKVNPSGYREIELYSNDEHAATPIDTVLTLSQNWADFDAIGFISGYNSEVGLCAYNEWKVSAISVTDRITLNFDIGSTENSFIYIIKASSSSFVVSGLNSTGHLSHVYKIIGIKY